MVGESGPGVVITDRNDNKNLYLKHYTDRYGHKATAVIKEVEVDSKKENILDGIEFDPDQPGML